MTMPQSVRAVDGGKIKGAQNCPNVIEVGMRFTLPNTKIGTVRCHGHYTTAPPNLQTVADALFVALKNGWTANLGTLMHTSTLFSGLAVRDMTSAANPVFLASGASVAGTGPGAAMPADVSAVLTESVSVRGRGAKGRMYVPGWTVDADAGGGSMTIAAQTGLNAWGTSIFNALNAQNLQPCVAKLERQAYIGLTGTQHDHRAATFAVVSSFVCRDTEWDTQRRRGH